MKSQENNPNALPPLPAPELSQPLLPPPSIDPTETYGSTPPSFRRRRHRVTRFMTDLLFRVVFLWLNGLLGIVGFVIVVLGLVLSFATLPVCCLGLLFLRLLEIGLRDLATLDIMLHNLIARDEEKIVFSSGEAPTGFRLARDLGSSCSSDTIMAVLYFGIVKFIFSGIFASLCAAFVSTAVIMVCSPIILFFQPSLCQDLLNGICDSAEESWAYFFLGIAVFWVSVCPVFTMTSLSMKLTRGCVSEYFSNIVHIYAPTPAYYGQAGMRIA